MEYLDFYDEYGNFLGKEEREIVHQKGLWHKTVHCWLYDKAGNVYFQIRSDSHKLYTTASGHVNAGETIKQAFAREVKEEIGVDVNVENAEMVEINVWKMDKEKSTGMIKDRAFANVYINLIEENKTFIFDKNEVEGLVKISAKDALNILKNESGEADSTKILYSDKGNIIKKEKITFEDFLIFKNEIGIIKYGKILQAIIKATY